VVRRRGFRKLNVWNMSDTGTRKQLQHLGDRAFTVHQIESKENRHKKEFYSLTRRIIADCALGLKRH